MMLSKPEEIQELAAELKKHAIISFDTEFIRESTFYPIVEVIQVGTSDRTWLVDAQVFKKGHRPGPQGGYDPAFDALGAVFMDKSILKIVHAAQADQECLYTSFGIVASPVLDTSVAASLCGYGDGVGLGKLLKSVLDVEIKKGHARTNWSVRPLPAQLLEYAHADVEHLVRLGEKLLEHLDKIGRRGWALEASAKWEDISLYEPDVDETARKLARGGRLDKKGYGALLELIKWREARVRALNLPRRWVADDAVLVDLAHVKPKDRAHLESFRGLNRGEVMKSSEVILEAIRRGAESGAAPAHPVSRGPRQEIPSAEENQVLDLLKCYVGILADRHQIAAKHLLTTAQLLPLLRSGSTNAADLEKKGLLSPSAAKLVGDELLAFLNGKRALSVEGDQIKIVEI
jgi:ribonuclease D